MRKEISKYASILCLLLFLLIIINIRLPILYFLVGTYIGNVIISDNFINTLSGLLIGLISSVIFAIFYEYIPNCKKRKNTIYTLNSLLSLIIDSYNRVRIFGHETSIKHVDRRSNNVFFLESEITKLKRNDVPFLKVKYGMQTASSKLDDFSNSLQFTITLDTKLQIQWLEIIEKVRLLAENYGTQPEANDEEISSIDKNDQKNNLFEYKQTLCLRMMEYFESVSEWHHIIENVYKISTN
jgi:hypothetical protein